MTAIKRRLSLLHLLASVPLLFALATSPDRAKAQDQDRTCANPASTCSAQVPPECLKRHAAGSIAVSEAAVVDCQAQLSGYRDCLILVVQQCESAEEPKEDRVQSGGGAVEACPREIETRLWDAIKDSDDETLIRHFLDTCTESPLAAVATAKLASLESAAAAAEPAPAALPVCPPNFENRSGTLRCQCAADSFAGTVWGSGLYTTDSSICRAALHAGAVGSQGGAVDVVSAPGQPSYSGTNRNGVTTQNWGAYRASFLFPGGADPASASAVGACPASFTGRVGALQCLCAPAAMRGSVWGSGPYTADSSICRAALHAGATSAEGGVVSLEAEAGQPSYQGTVRNGVQTAPWGAYQASFVFTGSSTQPLAAGEAVCPAKLDHLRGQSVTLSCYCPSGAFAGRVWGDGVYTDDSSVCRAALHAGRLGSDGGEVTLEVLGGQASYQGATRNGVETNAYGAWGGSYRFVDG
ncbi:MAG: LCCL domain-containing protein [Pseudomonadota bacterium]